MSEIMALRGRLATNEKLAHALTVGIDCDIDELRSIADKFEVKTELKTERMVILTDRIDAQVKKLRAINEQIKAIHKELGE